MRGLQGFFFWLPFHLQFRVTDDLLEKLICYYGADVLWAYSFTFYTLYWFQRSGKQRASGILLCLTAELGIELFQLTGIVKATFDVWDIVIEFAVTFIAAAIIGIIETNRVNGRIMKAVNVVHETCIIPESSIKKELSFYEGLHREENRNGQ